MTTESVSCDFVRLGVLSGSVAAHGELTASDCPGTEKLLQRGASADFYSFTLDETGTVDVHLQWEAARCCSYTALRVCTYGERWPDVDRPLPPGDYTVEVGSDWHGAYRLTVTARSSRCGKTVSLGVLSRPIAVDFSLAGGGVTDVVIAVRAGAGAWVPGGLKDHPAPEDVEYYLCGPPLMLKACMDMLDSLGVERDNILFDDFG